MSGYGWTEEDLTAHLAKFPNRALGGSHESLRAGRHVGPERGEDSGRSTPKKRQKFNAQPTVSRGRKFASKKEAQRYHELLLRLKAGEIRRLECQPVYFMHTENEIGEWVACGKFTPDFRYQERVRLNDYPLPEWREVVEDVKGGKATHTEAYRLRKRHVEAEYGITIVEV